MARVCTVCTHEDRRAIDAALVQRRPFRTIAQQYGPSVWALLRHHDDHLPVALSKAQEAQEAAHGADLLREVQALRAKAYSLLLKAEAAGDIRTALAGIREARACVELLAEMAGELDRRATINILAAPEWITVRSALLAALAP